MSFMMFQEKAQIVVAGKWGNKWLDLMSWFNGCHIVGFTFFWHTLLVRPGYEKDEHLIAHELTHVDQLREDWYIGQMVAYAYYSLTRGYKNNPYEIEAEKVENDAKLRKAILKRYNLLQK